MGSADRTRLRVGVVVDPVSPGWLARSLVTWSAARSDIELVPLAIEPPAGSVASHQSTRCTAPGFPGPCSRGLFKLLRRLEARLIGHAAQTSVLARAAASYPFAEKTVRIGAGDDAGERIATLGLDMLVHFGPHPASSALAARVRLGSVVSFYDGQFDDDVETAGFWQVVRRAPATGFVLVAHAPGGAEPLAIRRGSVRNRFSYLHNQIALYRKSLHAIQRLLADTAVLGRLPEPAAGVAPDIDRPPRGPTVSEQLAYFGRFLRAAAGRVLGERGIGNVARWTVHYAPVDWTCLDMPAAVPIPNPPRGFLADPFVIEEDGRVFCFVEELVFGENRGCIACHELTAAGPVRCGRVIEEPFHMSFPYLFRYRGATYMLPETSANRDVRVYRCVAMPGRWELAKVLMEDVSAADTMVFEHGGRWWMFTNLDPAETGDFCSELHIFHADDPLSDRWVPHAMNPVITDALRARNGGLLVDGDAIYRVSQTQAFDTYGSGFAINRIDVLTPESYAETPLPAGGPGPNGHLPRVHHMHSNGRVTVFDRYRLENIRR